MRSSIGAPALCLALWLVLAPSTRADKLVLVAGGGQEPDGAPATQSQLLMPFGVDFDKAGNLFLVELTGQRVRKVDRQGILTTVAGTGQKGDSGDGGPAIKAQFNGMHSL